MKEKTCKNCKRCDEYFGDCTHPKFHGSVVKAVEECLEKDYKYFEDKDSKKLKTGE